MKSPSGLVAFCAGAALLSTTAPAQNEKPPKVAPAPPSPTSTWQTAQAHEFFRLSKLVSRNVESSDGHKLGAIKDFAFNQQGELFALVDIGKNRRAVVPWEALNLRSAKGEQIPILNTSQQALQSGPVVTEEQWGAINNPSFTKGVYSYYHLQPPAAAGGTPESIGTATGGGSSKPQDKSDSPPKEKP